MTPEISPELDLTLWFYQNGIIRVLLEEPESGRFRISGEGLPVVEEQLIPTKLLSKRVIINDNTLIVRDLFNKDVDEVFRYEVEFDHFKIKQYSNEILTLIMNPVDSLYFENGVQDAAP